MTTPESTNPNQATSEAPLFHAADCHLVVPELERIATWCKERQDPVGYFAMLYRLTTLKIVHAVDKGRFEDNERMARMDEIFANRYLDAISARAAGQPASASWEVTFRAAANDEITVLQHLFVAMNAHINFDLPVAAAQTCPGDAIEDFEKDFAKINKILESLFDIVEQDVAKFWHPLQVLLSLGEDLGNLLLSFAMEAERKKAWERATELAKLEPEAQAARIQALDQEVAALGEKILDPGLVLSPILREIRKQEQGTVAEKIEAFHNQLPRL
ncbi:MAG: DUF5995 family protein [Acidobacteriota bacterium]